MKKCLPCRRRSTPKPARRGRRSTTTSCTTPTSSRRACGLTSGLRSMPCPMRGGASVRSSWTSQCRTTATPPMNLNRETRTSMDELIRDVAILGGGTAGWMAAAYLARAFGSRIRITLIEAPTIPKIGVGEATIPNLQKAFFDFLGIAEEEWMRHCNAAFKMGIRFVGWEGASERVGPNHFYHLFGVIPNCGSVPLSHYWTLRRYRDGNREPLAYACYAEAPWLDAKLAPRTLDGERVTHYAWHFDAHLVASYLQQVATGWGVRHVVDEFERAELGPDGRIASLVMRSGASHAADLFVDCSGFRGLLINKTLGEPFIDMTDSLLCDSAVATAVPHDDAVYGVE